MIIIHHTHLIFSMQRRYCLI